MTNPPSPAITPPTQLVMPGQHRGPIRPNARSPTESNPRYRRTTGQPCPPADAAHAPRPQANASTTRTRPRSSGLGEGREPTTSSRRQSLPGLSRSSCGTRPVLLPGAPVHRPALETGASSRADRRGAGPAVSGRRRPPDQPMQRLVMRTFLLPRRERLRADRAKHWPALRIDHGNDDL